MFITTRVTLEFVTQVKGIILRILYTHACRDGTYVNLHTWYSLMFWSVVRNVTTTMKLRTYLQDISSLQRRCWRFKSSGMWRC